MFYKVGLKFQFLLVRLKVEVGNILVYNGTQFQFLLVRLKDLMHKNMKKFLLISIPSGAIKRIVALCGFVDVAFISIPSGAIKSIKLSPNASLASIFQFLLVRLKGLHGTTSVVLLVISIPSGAIKSFISR